jgi:cysteinyl-tRNA synthetase
MLAGARVEVAPYKRSSGDFVLWKPSTPELPGWNSPWGRGRPGWHIECSAMCEAAFGETIDIHCGGIDLQFPHHENEIAQSVCAHGGQPFARWWLHNGMLNMDGRKMSKSLGNVFRIDEVLATHPAEALRLALMSAHYRQPLDWTDGLIEQCVRTLDRLYGTLRDLIAVEAKIGPIPDAVESALLDDLNTPQALAALSAIAAEARKAETDAERARLKSELLSGGFSLGLLQQDPSAWFARGTAGSELDAAAIEARVQERHAAKLARDFARADAIRKELAEQGIEIEDTPQGPRWKVAAK